MKVQASTILIILSNIFPVHSQTLVDTNKVWSVVETIFGGNSETRIYKFQGDTTLGSHTYKKLMRSNDSLQTVWYYDGAMREDSSRKVYFDTYINEYLYYDFGLNQNDTFTSVLDACPVEMVADSVDSVTLLNGESRKRILFSNGEIWIDGIGSLFGVKQVEINWCVFDVETALNCFTEDAILKFKNPAFGSCYYTTVGIEEISSTNSWTLSPNPFADFATLKFQNPENIPKTLKLFDGLGQLVKSISAITGDQVMIDRTHLQNGFYFFQLTDNRHSMVNGKLVVL